MGKLWQNNLFKLPVFLLLVSGICGVSLATVNYFTSTRIENNEKEARYATYTETFKDLYESDNVPSFVVNEQDVNDNLLTYGIDTKVEVLTSKNEEVGYVYGGSVKGFVDTVSFMVSFTNGKYHHFYVLSQKESKGNILTTLDSLISGYDVNSETNFFETSAYTNAVTGASRTDDNLVPALNACATDYLSIYSKGGN